MMSGSLIYLYVNTVVKWSVIFLIVVLCCIQKLYSCELVEVYLFCFFFFQAEDGIRDPLVTGVQTCALPISRSLGLTTVRRQTGGVGVTGCVSRSGSWVCHGAGWVAARAGLRRSGWLPSTAAPANAIDAPRSARSGFFRMRAPLIAVGTSTDTVLPAKL